MKGSHAVVLGIIAGAALGILVVTLGALPVEISFTSFLLLFLFSTVSLVMFSLFGWPERQLGFDYYDLHRFIIGVTCTTGSFGVVMKAGEKIAITFSLPMLSSMGIAAGALGIYAAISVGIYHAVKLGFSQKQPQILAAWDRSSY